MSLKNILAPGVISERNAVAEILLCVLFWGASFAAMKVSVARVEPLLAVWLRMALGLFLIVPAASYRDELRRPFRDEAVPLLALAFLGIVFHQNIQFLGMRSAGVANSNWMIAATPAAVAVLGVVFLKERVNAAAILGLLFAGTGVLLVVGLGTKGFEIFATGGTGDLLIAISAVNWAVFQIMSRGLLRECPPTFAILWLNIFAFLIQSLAVFIFWPQDFWGLLHVPMRDWYVILFLGCVCSGLCYILWYDGLSALTAARVSAFQFIQPVVGVIVAYFFMGERFTPYIYAGGAMILIGVWLINNAKD
ncbi:MAG: DMT family transporter [Synergistaceae bacterium]|jgi:drug/metabolite transporter (DMT)-like permease|nr:DMT family transporter [Synergistaceae bacterium]